MRLSPPTASPLPREILKGGINVGDQTFSEAIDIGVPIYVLHRNESYLPNPHSFRPGRWDPSETSKEAIALTQSAFTLSSLGRAVSGST